jgi:hypothetical protein
MTPLRPRASSAPLTDADYQEINKRLGRLDQVRVALEKARAAGFPCAEQDDACKALEAQLKQIKSVYFPERP